MTLGQKLRHARLMRGMTQAQVAGERITRNMLSQVENDLASPSVRTLEYLASVLNVRLSWLLAGEAEESEAARSEQLRELLRAEDYSGCLACAPEQNPDDEQALALAAAAAQCARRALEAERFDTAQHLARQALRWNAGSVYASESLALQLQTVLLRCAQNTQPVTEAALADYRQSYHAQRPRVWYHLTLARCLLAQDRLDDAQQELRAVSEPPQADRAEYLILRAQLAAKAGQYEAAARQLRQAEALGPLPKLLARELFQGMELVSRELQDYKTAYEYAARQLKL